MHIAHRGGLWRSMAVHGGLWRGRLKATGRRGPLGTPQRRPPGPYRPHRGGNDGVRSADCAEPLALATATEPLRPAPDAAARPRRAVCLGSRYRKAERTTKCGRGAAARTSPRTRRVARDAHAARGGQRSQRPDVVVLLAAPADRLPALAPRRVACGSPRPPRHPIRPTTNRALYILVVKFFVKKFGKFQ